ncbi:MAG TPA: OmpH family outer membrane protein, partial [Terriglobia bacterium]|nr:OmpH family outer membrane protein [Terriglobia bacterium]
KLNTFANDQRAAIAKKQQEADDLANRLRTQDRALSEAARNQLNKDLQTAETSMQTMADDAQKKLAQMRVELLAPIEQKTAMAVSSYANEHSVKIVLDASALQSGLVYVHDTADITTEIIRRIATDLENHHAHASLDPQKFLNRTWLATDLRPDHVRELPAREARITPRFPLVQMAGK